MFFKNKQNTSAANRQAAFDPCHFHSGNTNHHAEERLANNIDIGVTDLLQQRRDGAHQENCF